MRSLEPAAGVRSPAARMGTSARVRFGVSLALGLGVAAVIAPAVSWPHGLLAGLMALAGVFVAWTRWALRGFDAEQTRSHARQEDAGGAVTDAGVLLTVVASLTAVAVLLASSGAGRILDGALAVGSVALSWFMLHTMYTGRYARAYYADENSPGGIDFNTPGQRPAYRDFVYFAFNLGMTYQVSDTDVSDPDIRQLVLRHSLMSYFFGTAILATIINLVVGLAG